MKKLFLLLTTLSFVACFNGGNELAYVDLTTPNNIDINELAATVDIKFSTDSPWEITQKDGEDWCTLDKYSGESADSVVVVATVTEGGSEPRTSNLELTSGGIIVRMKINQEAITMFDFTAPEVDTLVGGGQTANFYFSTNKSWTIEVLEGEEWCSLTKKVGDAGENIKAGVIAKANEDSLRTAEVKVSAGLRDTTFKMLQIEIPLKIKGVNSAWDCFVAKVGDVDSVGYDIAGSREFTVNLTDTVTAGLSWRAVSGFSENDMICENMEGVSGEAFTLSGIRTAPGDVDILDTITIYKVDVDGNIVAGNPVYYPITITSSGKLPDAANNKFVSINGVSLRDRNLGVDVPSVKDTNYAYNYTNALLDVNSDFKGDYYTFADATSTDEIPEGWRLPSTYEITLISERVIVSKGRVFVISDDKKTGTFLPLSGNSSSSDEVAGYYWSSDSGSYLKVSPNSVEVLKDGNPSEGYSIRLVRSSM